MENLEDKNQGNLPTKLDIEVNFRGQSVPIWHYMTRPDEMRSADISDLYIGRQVMYRVKIGPDAGDWYCEPVRQSNYYILCQMIKDGEDVLIK